MKIKVKSFIYLLSLAALVSSAQAVVVTSFGSGIPTFTIDGGSTTFATTQQSSSLDISGSDFGSILAGTFSSVNVAPDETAITLYLFGSASSAPASSFTVTLFDSGFTNTAIYEGGSWTSIGSIGYSTLTYQSGSLDSTDISGIQLDTAGVTGSIVANLTSLQTAVPEPSTYAAIAGILALGFTVIRRRRQRG